MLHSNPRGRAAAALSAAALALLWSGPSPAGSACLKGAAPNKLCLQLSSAPGSEVQPSGLAGTKTYVQYTVDLRNLVAATSRNVLATLSLEPAPPSAVAVAADAGLTCSVSGATVSCLADKLDGIDMLSFRVTAEAPTHPTTVSQIVATGVVGWNGNTTLTTHTLAVSNTAGNSYVPAGTEVTLATSDSDDVTAENPRYGRVTLPPQAFDYVASIEVIGNAAANSNCVNGVYFSTTYGGPYICRDTATPRRAISIDVGNAVFTTERPIVFTEKWDTTIVPATQLPPTPAAPTGLPPFAQFAAPLSTTGTAAAPYSALVLMCNDATGNLGEPPCLTQVRQLPNGDWEVASLRTNDGDYYVKHSPLLAPLYAVLDFLISPAEAQTIPKPGIGNQM